MNSERRAAAIGVDVGGTKIAGGVVSRSSGEVLFPCTVPTLAERGGAAVLAAVTEMIQNLLAEARAKQIRILGAGIGVAELVDAEGNITSGQTIPWTNLSVRERLSELCPVQVESDVRAAALAESMFGAGRKFGTFVYITAGTGISSCFVQEGRPLAGARGNALVMASSPLSTVCTGCGKQLHPILEEFASGPALASRYRTCLESEGHHWPAGSRTGAEPVFAAAKAGDNQAAEILRSGGIALGVSAAFLVNVLDPEAVIVGGGLGLAGGLYWESFVNSAREHIWSPCTRALPVIPAALGVQVGVIGAAAKIFCGVNALKESHSA